MRNKKRRARKPRHELVGNSEMPESTSMSELLSQIELLENGSAVHGIPLCSFRFRAISTRLEVIAAIPPEKRTLTLPYSKCRTHHDQELRFSSVYSGGRYEAS